MSEAPKNGTWILWAMPGGRYCVIRWPEFEECWHDGHGVWQPLPEMPPAGDARERLEKVLAGVLHGRSISSLIDALARPEVVRDLEAIIEQRS